ncbi:MAG: ribokinase [Micromonosporaceae bacterium]
MSPAETGSGLDVAILGSFMKDLVARAPRRPAPGETLRGTGFDEFLGGKGVNQAVAASRAGARTAMIGRLGKDLYGEEFLQLLESEGIDAAQVRRDADLGTGVGLPVVEPDGANSIIIVPRANDAVGAADVHAAAETIGRARSLSVQLELSVDSAYAAGTIASDAGVIAVLNPAPCPVAPELLRGLFDVVVPNEVEAEQLTGLSCEGEAAVLVARRVADEWARRGAVLTLGGRGAIVVDGGDVEWLPPHRIPVIDTIGAGDAFCGALAARLAAGASLTDSARYANAAGALATTVSGAVPAMPRHEAIAALLAERSSTTDTNSDKKPHATA